MVVFVAIVLVAAVAAGVLIGTSSDLEQTPEGHDPDGRASGLGVESLVGQRGGTDAAALDTLEIYLALSPGSDDVDLPQLRIQVHNATDWATLHHGVAALGDRYAASAVRDADGSVRAVAPSMTAGDLVRIDIDLAGAGIGIEAGDPGRVVVLPEHGTPSEVAFTAPAGHGSTLAMHLI